MDSMLQNILKAYRTDTDEEGLYILKSKDDKPKPKASKPRKKPVKAVSSKAKGTKVKLKRSG